MEPTDMPWWEGRNYGQGSSREHAALAPRYLGLRVVLARGFARIHGQNLVNFGILPLEFVDPAEYDQLGNGDILVLKDLREKTTSRSYLDRKSHSRAVHLKVAMTFLRVKYRSCSKADLINWVKQRL